MVTLIQIFKDGNNSLRGKFGGWTPHPFGRVYVVDRINQSVDEETIDGLYRMIPDFVRAYDEGGVSIEEFDTYGASVRTLRGFISGYHELMAIVRDFMLPNPDVRNT